MWTFEISRDRRKSGFDKQLIIRHPEGSIVARRNLPNDTVKSAERILECVEFWNKRTPIFRCVEKCSEILL